MYVLCNKEFNGTFSGTAAHVALGTRERIVRTNTPLDTLRNTRRSLHWGDTPGIILSYWLARCRGR